MSARKPKPTLLKEKTSSQPADPVGLSRLFAQANALVAEKPAEFELPKVDKDNKDHTLKLEDPTPRAKSTIASTRSRSRSSSATQIKKNEFNEIPPARETTTHTRAKLSPWLFLLPAFALLVYVLLAPDSGFSTRKSHLTDSQIEDRVDFHRGLTGSRLNRERIDVQIQNHLNAPDLPPSTEKIKPADMMAGLPLEGEGPTYTKKADRAVNPSDPEAKIMYGLQEEQERSEYEKRAHQAWLNEFIMNARRDGVAIKIDNRGNVQSTVIPESQRLPTSALPGETGTSGGVNSGASTETFIDN